MADTRVVIVGGGFGGYFAARRLSRMLRHSGASVTLVSESDGLLYQPLLPDVAVGAVDARDVVVPLNTSLPRVEVLRGRATAVDLDGRTVAVAALAGDTSVGYDYLLLAPGSVTRMLDIPGLAEHAIGFKTPAEALYLRDLVLSRMEAANADTDPVRRRAALTFVVVGAGYAGTELVAQFSRLTDNLLPVFPKLGRADVHWLLLDTASAVMPELGSELGSAATDLLRKRGVDVRLKTSVQSLTATSVKLTDGTDLDCSTVVWCAGVTGNPLVGGLGLPLEKGRLVVTAQLNVDGRPEVFAIGDAAAVPDIINSTPDHAVLCPPTAQHAMRQGPAAARNIVRAVKGEPLRPYRHHDLGLVVDLGGPDAAAKPLGISLDGLPAKVVTRGYHLYALPTGRRRALVATSWLLAGRRPDDVSLGLVPSDAALATHAEDEPG